MAGERRQVDQGVANQVVRENLGLTAEDLGMDRPNAFEGLDIDEGDDDFGGDDNSDLDFEQPQARQQERVREEPPIDDLRVSHTRQSEQQRGQQRQQPRPLPKNAQVRADQKGNLVGQDGRIVARAGAEARLYVDNHKLRGQLEQANIQSQRQVRDVQGRLEKAVQIGTEVLQRYNALREAGNVASRYGLSESEINQAAELAQMAKTNPIGALKSLLTRAAANGIDLTQLGLQPGSVDSKSLLDLVRQEIGNVVKPIQQRTEQETAQQKQQREADEARQSVQRELTDFLQDNPAARQYLPIFQQIYANPRLSHMSLGEVWSRLQLNLMKRGIDPDQPIQRSPNPDGGERQRRLPNGRGNPPGGEGGREVPLEIAPVTDSYEDIVRSVLSRHGQ